MRNSFSEGSVNSKTINDINKIEEVDWQVAAVGDDEFESLSTVFEPLNTISIIHNSLATNHNINIQWDQLQHTMRSYGIFQFTPTTASIQTSSTLIGPKWE